MLSDRGRRLTASGALKCLDHLGVTGLGIEPVLRRFRKVLMNPPFPGIAESQSLPDPTLSKNVPSAATGLSGNTR